MNTTNLKKSLIALMLVAAGSTATSANAFEWVNGYEYNALTENALTENALTENALTDNALSANGGGENGFVTNDHTMTPDAGRTIEKPEGESKLPRLERSTSPLPAPMISSRRIAE